MTTRWGTAEGAQPFASDELVAELARIPVGLRRRAAHLVDECGPRIGGQLIRWLLEKETEARLDQVERAYEGSQLSRTDLDHEDGFVRHGAEDKFLRSLGITPPA